MLEVFPGNAITFVSSMKNCPCTLLAKQTITRKNYTWQTLVLYMCVQLVATSVSATYETVYRITFLVGVGGARSLTLNRCKSGYNLPE